MDPLAKHLERLSPEQQADFERSLAGTKARARALREEWWPRLLQLSITQAQVRPLTRREEAQVKIIWAGWQTLELGW